MNKRGPLVKLFSFISILIIGCVEPYAPPNTAANISIVVVDGFLNATDNSAMVRLTKAIPLTESDEYPAVKNAEVIIRSESGDSFTLVEQDSGRYYADGLTVDLSTKYQLSVRTSDNLAITSDFISVFQTPPIDSVTWRPEEDGVTILVNTHDDAESSRYYHWDYIETWQYHAPYPSRFTNEDDVVYPRGQENMIYTCYRTVPSTKIVVGSTQRLSENIVRDFPLTYMQSGSSRLSVLYSIKVRQRVIDNMEYEFMQDLKRVTESVGGLFDSQPYEILGNIHSNDPSIPVLGYFSAGFVDEKRIFLSFFDLPDHLQKIPYTYCDLDTVCTGSIIRPCTMDLQSIPEHSYLIADLTFIFPGYTVATKACADCRVQGGVTTKPDFWP